MSLGFDIGVHCAFYRQCGMCGAELDGEMQQLVVTSESAQGEVMAKFVF